jgi:hypothetical protein
MILSISYSRNLRIPIPSAIGIAAIPIASTSLTTGPVT